MKNPEYLIAEILREDLKIPFSNLQLKSVGGGSINETFRVSLDSNKHFFLKLNSSRSYPALFEKEKSGLSFLAQQKIILIPEVVACKTVDDIQLLLIEWIDSGLKDRIFWQSFGEQLARLHRISDAQFGFYEDNYIGTLSQINVNKKSWIDFFIHC